MAQSSTTASSIHPGVRRSVTLPPTLQNNNGRGAASSDAVAGYETLLSLPMARTVSFNASMGTCKAINASTSEAAGTIPWTSSIERLEAAGKSQRYYASAGQVC